MARAQKRQETERESASSVLTQTDAESFRKAVSSYGKSAKSSKAKARAALKSLGVYTPTGRLSKRYG